MNKNLKERAITLIALTITIVVLIILAGVAISLSLGENGLFNKTHEAKKNYEMAISEEQNELSEFTNKIDSIIGTRDLDENQFKILFDKYFEQKSLKSIVGFQSGNVTFSQFGAGAGESKTITLGTPLQNANYSVVVTCTSNVSQWANVEFCVYDKTASGFKIYGWNPSTLNTGGVITANWILLPN